MSHSHFLITKEELELLSESDDDELYDTRNCYRLIPPNDRDSKDFEEYPRRVNKVQALEQGSFPLSMLTF